MENHRAGALVVQWASAIPGREQKLLEILRRVLDFCERLRTIGRVEDVRLFISKTGQFRETLMLFGHLDELARIVVEPKFESLVAEGTLVIRDIDIAIWEGGPPNWMLQNANPYVDALQTNGFI